VAEDKLIGVNLAWGGMSKRLWLSGPAGEDGRTQLKRALMELDVEGDGASDWPSFLALAVDVFKKHGFLWVDY